MMRLSQRELPSLPRTVTIAYLGRVAGWRTVADAIADPMIAAFISGLMQEAATLFEDLATFGVRGALIKSR